VHTLKKQTKKYPQLDRVAFNIIIGNIILLTNYS